MANRFLRLPLAFEPDRLLDDLNRCLRTAWTAHVNQRDYAGDWTGIALRSTTGAANDILSIAGVDDYRDTPLLAECPCFTELLDSLQCDKETVRLLRLAAGSVIREHRDRGASYGDGFLRLHVPITTNARTRFVVEGEALPMQPGECWYADFSLTHSVHNDGTTDRVHLIVDARRNDWTDRLFARAGYDFEAEAREREMDPDTRRRVVAELRAQRSDTALRLAAALEAESTASSVRGDQP